MENKMFREEEAETLTALGWTCVWKTEITPKWVCSRSDNTWAMLFPDRFVLYAERREEHSYDRFAEVMK